MIAGEDGVDVAVADRGGLGEDDLQQAPGGGELVVEVGEQRGAEPGLCRRGGEQRGAHLVPSWLMALSICDGEPEAALGHDGVGHRAREHVAVGLGGGGALRAVGRLRRSSRAAS